MPTVAQAMNNTELCPPHQKLAKKLAEFPQRYICPQCAVNQIEELKEALSACELREAEVRKALEPFAWKTAFFPDEPPMMVDICVTVRDLQRCARVLAALGEPNPQ